MLLQPDPKKDDRVNEELDTLICSAEFSEGCECHVAPDEEKCDEPDTKY